MTKQQPPSCLACLNTSAFNTTCVVAVFAVIMFVHAALVTEHARRAAARPPGSGGGGDDDDVAAVKAAAARADAPDVIIFRRTKKTGSSSMLEELLRVGTAQGYEALYHAGARMRTVVRGEEMSRWPRRLLVAQHNAISREDTGGRRAVIMDTVLDGYRQITSFCRFVEGVQDCDEELVKCMEGPAALNQRYYRWAGRKTEDAATFIDMPLSSAHPAVSTTVFRRLFPGERLDIKKRNAAGSACPENAKIRDVYERHYADLEQQVKVLTLRMLGLANYPVVARDSNATAFEMLDEAEKLEKSRYEAEEGYKFGTYEETTAVAADHLKLKREETKWKRDRSGSLVLS